MFLKLFAKEKVGERGREKKERWRGKKRKEEQVRREEKRRESEGYEINLCSSKFVGHSSYEVRGKIQRCKGSKRRKSEVRKYDGSVERVGMETEAFRWHSGVSLTLSDPRPVQL